MLYSCWSPHGGWRLSMGRRVVMAMGRCVLCLGHRCSGRRLLVRRDIVLLKR